MRLTFILEESESRTGWGHPRSAFLYLSSNALRISGSQYILHTVALLRASYKLALPSSFYNGLRMKLRLCSWGTPLGLFLLPGGRPRPCLATTGSAGSGSGAGTSGDANSAGGSACVGTATGTSAGFSVGKERGTSGEVLVSPVVTGFAERSSRG